RVHAAVPRGGAAERLRRHRLGGGPRHRPHRPRRLRRRALRPGVARGVRAGARAGIALARRHGGPSRRRLRPGGTLMADIRLLLVTTPPERAEEIVTALARERLIACG